MCAEIFGRSLARLEEEVASLLAPEKGVVSSILSSYEAQIRSLSQNATAAFEKRVTHVVERLEETNTRLGSLLQLAVEAKALLLANAQQLEARTSNTSNLFNFLSRKELETSAAAQRALAIEQLEGFKKQLAGMTLKEHVLEGLVDSYLQKRASLRDSRGVTPDLSLLDVSSLFDGPRASSVCSVLTHLLQKKAPHQEIASVFVQVASPPSAALALAAASATASGGGAPLQSSAASNAGAVAVLGAIGALPPTVVAVPPASAVIAAARLWKRRTDVYGHKGHAYAVVRIEGPLVEVFTVPFLESEPYILTGEEALHFVNGEELPRRLQDLVNALGINAAMNSLPETLVVYLGSVPNSEGGPPPSRRRSLQRVELLRALSPAAADSVGPVSQRSSPRLDLSSPVAAAFWGGSHAQLVFMEAAETLLKKALGGGLAAQVSVRRLDAEVLVIASSSAEALAPPPCRLGPHLREVFHVLQVRLYRRLSSDTLRLVFCPQKALAKPAASLYLCNAFCQQVRLTEVSEGSFVVPSDSVIASAVSTLTRSVSVGAPSCAIAASTSWTPPERFWKKPQFSSELFYQSPSTNAFSRALPAEVFGGGSGASSAKMTSAASQALLLAEAAADSAAERGAGGGSEIFQVFLPRDEGRPHSAQALFPGGGPQGSGFAAASGVATHVGESSELTAYFWKKTSLPAIVASLAQTVERVLLFSEAWARGFSLFVLLCVENKDCPEMRRQ